MITYRSGEVVLANLSFISGTGSKRRPVLILLDVGDSDVIIAPVTSQSAQSRFEVALQEWQQSGLVQPSVVRVHKVTTIEKQALLRTLGALSSRDWAQVRARVKQLWSAIQPASFVALTAILDAATPDSYCANKGCQYITGLRNRLGGKP